MSHKLQKESLTEKFVEAFIVAILSSEYPPEELIPSEAELANRFGVSRTLIREGISRLTTIGMIDKHQGKVSKINPRKRWNFLDHTLLKVVVRDEELRTRMINDIFAMRILLEGQAAQESANHRSDEDLQVIAKLIAEEEQHPQSHEFVVKADRMIHEIIIASMDNLIFSSVVRNFQEVLEEADINMIVKDTDSSVSIGHHRDIYECLEKRDGKGARLAMEKHLRWTIDSLILT